MLPSLKKKTLLGLALLMACSGAIAGPGSTPVAKAAAPEKLTVYDDQLSSAFADYSWANHSLADKTTFHAGTQSIRMKPNNDDALYLYKDRILIVSDYSQLELWVNGGKESGQKLELVIQAGGQSVATQQLDSSLFGAGTWQKISVDLGKLNVPNGIFDGILIRGTVSGQQPDVYFDDIVLAKGAVVAAKTLTGIAVSSASLQLKKGAGGTLVATGAYSDGTKAPLAEGVAWSTSNAEVATVSNGAVTALKAGSAVLTASYGTLSATVNVTVTDIAPPPPVDDGQAGIAIYGDTLHELFQDNSWAQHNLADTTIVHTGTNAISFDPSNSGGFYLYKGSGAVNVKDYDRLEFWINGGEAGAQQLELVFNAGGEAGARVNIGSLIEGGIPASGWTKVLLHLPELNIKNNIFDGLLFLGLTDGAQGTVYLDDIRLLEKYVAPPTLTEGVPSQYGMVLAPGDRAKVAFEARYSDSTSADVSDKAVWTSDNPGVVAVDKGALTAAGNGLAKITATFGTATASMYVQVVGYTTEAAYADSLAAGYGNWSWGTNNFDNTQPVASGTKSISFLAKGYEGIWLHRDAKMDMDHYYGVSFKVHGGATGGQKLQVNMMDGRNYVGNFDLATVLPDGVPANKWTEVKLKFADLGLAALTFDGIVVAAWGEHDQGTVYFDDIDMLRTTETVRLPAPELPTVQVAIDSTQGRRTLNPGIFGVNFEDSPSDDRSTMNFPIKRWGGNAMTRYNWQIDTTNRGGDWYFLNVPYDNPDPSQLPKAPCPTASFRRRKMPAPKCCCKCRTC